MKIKVSRGKESMASAIETKLDEVAVASRKAVRDVKRELQGAEDKVKDKLDEANLRIKKAKKKVV